MFGMIGLVSISPILYLGSIIDKYNSGKSVYIKPVTWAPTFRQIRATGQQGGSENSLNNLENEIAEDVKKEIENENHFSFIYSHPLDLGNYNTKFVPPPEDKLDEEKLNEIQKEVEKANPSVDFYIISYLAKKNNKYLAICENCDNTNIPFMTGKKNQWVLIDNTGVNFFENYITRKSTYGRETYKIDNEYYSTTGIKSLEEFIDNSLKNNPSIIKELFDRLKEITYLDFKVFQYLSKKLLKKNYKNF